jgi:hypothetical protein
MCLQIVDIIFQALPKTQEISEFVKNWNKTQRSLIITYKTLSVKINIFLTSSMPNGLSLISCYFPYNF